MNWLFDGPLGLVTAPIMARQNAPAEREAVEVLAPSPSDAVLLIGFGPGIGITELLPRLPSGSIGGIDPSWAMNMLARRRADAKVRLVRTTAARLPWPDGHFDGATAVNSIQLWNPLAASCAEVARVLRPGARLVTITHDWVLKDVDRVTEALTAHGFTDLRQSSARADKGRAILLVATAR